MSKTFIVPNTNLLTATLTDGTLSAYSPLNFSSSNTLTNEERATDQFNNKLVTSWAADDALKIDLGSAQSIDTVAIFMDSSTPGTDDISVYGATGDSAAASTTSNFTNVSEGWNINTFSSDSKQYWYIRGITSVTGLAEVIIGTTITFSLSPDFGIHKGAVYGVENNAAFGGAEYSTKKHDERLTWEFGWSNISQTFMDTLSAMRTNVGIEKKFLYYDGTSYYWVKLLQGSLEETEVSDGRFSTNCSLAQQLI